MIQLASLFNLSGTDGIIIFGVVFLLFGAKKLPELAKGLGQAVKEFTRAKDDFTRELERPQLDPHRDVYHDQDHGANHHALPEIKEASEKVAHGSISEATVVPGAEAAAVDSKPSAPMSAEDRSSLEAARPAEPATPAR